MDFFEICGVSGDKIRPISSVIDKLDKETWESVKTEMLDKGLFEESCNKIEKYAKIKGNPNDVLSILKGDNEIISNEKSIKAINDFIEILSYTDKLGCTQYINLDLSMARGLDYYTGIIYECIIVDKNFGSIIVGDRYDKLIGMFSSQDIPSVEFSVGIDRLMAPMADTKTTKSTSNDVYVVYKNSNLVDKHLDLCDALRAMGLNVVGEYDPYENNNKLKKYISSAVTEGVPVICLVGEKDNIISVKDVKNNIQTDFEILNENFTDTNATPNNNYVDIINKIFKIVELVII